MLAGRCTCSSVVQSSTARVLLLVQHHTCNIKRFAFGIPQAKTTKKIVLRLACSVCKAVHMHPIKRKFTLQCFLHA